MASSKNSPGPRDRNPNNPRERCKQITRLGKRCQRWAARGGLCKYHINVLKGAHTPPDPTVHDELKAGEASKLRSQLEKAGVGKPGRTSYTQFIVSEQARAALKRLGAPNPDGITDPKRILLDSVESAWRQRQLWEALMAAVPEEDFAWLGSDLPKGARIEIIQKQLLETTKVAARASKLAIDAGIEERIVRLAEEQAALIADTVRTGVVAAIGSLGLSAHAEKVALEAALQSAGTHLRKLAAGGEEYVDSVATAVAPKSTRKAPVEVR